MMRVCRKEGKKNPDVWVRVLSHLVNHASSGDTNQPSPEGKGNEAPRGQEDDGDMSSEEEEAGGGEGRWDDVRELLSLIERDQVLPPLRVGMEKSFCGSSMDFSWVEQASRKSRS